MRHTGTSTIVASVRPGAPRQNRPNERPSVNHGDRRPPSPGPSLNTRARKSQRRSGANDRCCPCTYDRKCSSDPRTNCQCRRAGRECWNCLCRRCENRPSTRECRTPPPGDRSICHLVATTNDDPPSGPPPEDPGRTTTPSEGLLPPLTPTDPTVAPPPVAHGRSGSECQPAEPPIEPNNSTIDTRNTVTGISAFPDLSQESGTDEPGDVVEAGVDTGTTPTDGGLMIVAGNNDEPTTPEDEGQGPGSAAANDPEQLDDLARQSMTACDQKLIAVYGDTTHRNDGRHLTGGIDDDALWQRRYDKVTANSHGMYFPPKGAVGKEVVTTYAAELEGVRKRHWNSERPLCFLACVLRRRPGCIRSADIRRRVKNRLALWQAGKFDALIQDITSTALANAGGGSNGANEEAAARSFHSQVMDGKLRTAVRNLCGGARGGVLGPEDPCTKTGRPVIEVLRAKHPDQRMPDLDNPHNIAFREYEDCPDPVPIDCTIEDVEVVANRLHGSAGCSSVDAALLKTMLLRFQQASTTLRVEMVQWVHWLANTSPPWAAYRAMKQGRLVALDKQPGVRPLGIGEIWLRAVSKCVLKDCGKEGKDACGSTQLCAGLEAGIEGALHAVRAKAASDHALLFEEWEINDDLWRADAADGEVPPWETNDGSTAETEHNPGGEEDGGTDPFMLSLADADNGFNNLNRMAMLWEVRHRWARGSRFAFNMYRHHTRLMVRGPTGVAPQFLLSREGVTQGCPLGMILYGVALMPLAEDLREAYPEALQPWYADDFAIYARASVVAGCFTRLCEKGPSVGYFPAPAKSWGICPRRQEHAAKTILEAAGLPLLWSRGQRYVGGFIGSLKMRERWLDAQIQKWVRGVDTLAGVARRFPQAAYIGLTQCLQAEWQYLCRVEPDVGPSLQPIEEAIRTKFLPSLFDFKEPISDNFRRLLAQGVKQGGIAIRDPVEGASRLHQASMDATAQLVESLVSGDDLNCEAHLRCVRAAGSAARAERANKGKEFLEETSSRGGRKAKKRIDRLEKSGSWLSCIPDRFSGNALTCLEFRDNLCLRYGLKITDLPSKCDGCGNRFSVEHGLSCKIGGLVGTRHDDVRDEWAHLCSLATTASKVSIEPLIFPDGAAPHGATRRAHTGSTNDNTRGGNIPGTPCPSNAAGNDARGDVRCRDFWSRARDCIFDVRICDTDATSYGTTASDKILERFARQKRDKYESACNENRRDFTPLVYCVDGMPCEAAEAAEKRLAALLASKWNRAYSEMVSFVRQRLSLAIVRSNTMLLRGERANTWR